MAQKATRAGLIISSSLTALACGAAEDRGPNDSEMTTTLEHSVRVEPKILNAFTTREEEIQFIRMGEESPTYLLSFAGSTNIGEGLTQALMREHPGLTLLETFRALAPEGETPHPELEAFHVTQTEIFDRPNTVCCAQPGRAWMEPYSDPRWRVLAEPRPSRLARRMSQKAYG